jgi:hypothetical protein
MKILKTSALAVIMACASLNANATYDGTANISVNVTTADQLTVVINSGNGALTFNNLIDGDSIDATVPVRITGDTTAGNLTTAREITCTLEGNSISDTSSVAEPLYSSTDTSAVIATITFQLSAACEQSVLGHDNTLEITSNDIASSVAGSTYETGTLSFVASYTAQVDISGHSSAAL